MLPRVCQFICWKLGVIVGLVVVAERTMGESRRVAETPGPV
jgi:hypothetical protein